MADAHSPSPGSDKLGVALRALPLHPSGLDGWPALAAALQARTQARPAPRRRHRLAMIAMAASIVIAAILPWSNPSPPGTTAQNESAAPTALEELTWMQRRSVELETWLASLPTAALSDGHTSFARVEIEDLIGLVDLQLDASRDSNDALPLWRRRVALLEELSLVRSASYTVADAAPASLHDKSTVIL